MTTPSRFCANCGTKFTQQMSIGTQVYCSYMCHLEATREAQP